LIRGLLGQRRDIAIAVSATTRPQRPGERAGREYYFLSEEEFDRRLAAGDFLEHVVYVSGQRYGTLNEEVDRILRRGDSCLLELETQGAKSVAAARGDVVTIFIGAPSFEELHRRLEERATESAGEIGERVALARSQIEEARDFDYQVLNDDVDRATDELVRLVDAALDPAGTLRPRC
jgi:guanylate kinase